MNKNVKHCQKCGRIIGKAKHICSDRVWNKGISGYKCRMKISKKGRHYSPSTEFKKGLIPWNKGIPHSEITKLKISGKVKGNKHSAKANVEKSIRMMGEKHPNWQGGKSFETYGFDWVDDLKESIRKRDNYVCKECGIHQIELGRKLDCHHIDYDKKNCNPDNLIVLCESCHMKTNFNRDYWIEYFDIKLC